MNTPLYSAALSLLTSQDYSVQRIREKLQKKFPTQYPAIEETIQKLQQEKYIDDERYAMDLINFWKEHSHYSVQQMKQKLFVRKIPAQTIQTIFENTTITDSQALKTLCEHKWKLLQEKENTHEKRKEKLFRYLLGKGFLWNDIEKIYKEI